MAVYDTTVKEVTKCDGPQGVLSVGVGGTVTVSFIYGGEKKIVGVYTQGKHTLVADHGTSITFEPKANPGYKSNREKFDWVVLGLNIVIEIHGEQHYKPVCFGGITLEEAKRNFRKRQEVDYKKQLAAEKAGWKYIVIKYTEKDIEDSEIIDKILSAEQEEPKEIVPARPKQKIQSRGFQKTNKKYNWPIEENT